MPSYGDQEQGYSSGGFPPLGGAPKGYFKGGVNIPVPLQYSPEIWLDAAAGVTESSGSVSGWADQSGNSNDFSQLTGLRQPSYNASDSNFNNLPSISFDGSNDVLQNTGLLLDNGFSTGVLFLAWGS